MRSAQGLSSRAPAVREFFAWVSEVRLTEAAAASSFWVLVALGPAGLVTINILGLFLPQETIAGPLARLARSAPGSYGDLLARQFVDISRNSPGTFIADLFLVVVSLWTISTAVAMLMRGLRRSYRLARKKFVPVRIVAVAVSMGVIVIVGALAFLVDAPNAWLSLLGSLIAMIVLTGAVLLVYLAAVGDSASARHLWPGAVFSAIGLTLVQHLWEGIASLSPNMTAIYGPVSGLVVSMLGVWISVMCLFIGQFINLFMHPWSSAAVLEVSEN